MSALKQPTRPAPLPSVHELGRHLAATEAPHHQVDCASIAAKDDVVASMRLDQDMELIRDRAQALRDMIVTLPPMTLADAAVQLAIVAGVADDLFGNENSPEEVSRLAAIVVRVSIAVLPIVAEAGGLDMAAMRWDVSSGFHASRFAALERLA